MRDPDPERYYAVLNVSPGASAQEIKLAYEFLKRAHHAGGKVNDIPRVLTAWEVLSDPAKRKEYDEGGETNAGKLRQALKAVRAGLGSKAALVVATVAFVALVGLLFAPGWVTQLRSFSPGDHLVWKANGAPIGRVVTYEPNHEFPGGVRAAGYRIQKDSGEPVWMPARDLQRYGQRATDG
jgi:curved DNA-binding protein CbpA